MAGVVVGNMLNAEGARAPRNNCCDPVTPGRMRASLHIMSILARSSCVRYAANIVKPFALHCSSSYVLLPRCYESTSKSFTPTTSSVTIVTATTLKSSRYLFPSNRGLLQMMKTRARETDLRRENARLAERAFSSVETEEESDDVETTEASTDGVEPSSAAVGEDEVLSLRRDNDDLRQKLDTVLGGDASQTVPGEDIRFCDLFFGFFSSCADMAEAERVFPVRQV